MFDKLATYIKDTPLSTFNRKYHNGEDNINMIPLVDVLEPEEVTTLKLSDFWEDNLNFQQIDLLKLDIEGEEFKVLKNIKDLLNNIHLIQFEFGEANIATKVFFKDFWSLLTNSGFKIYRYTHYQKLISVDHYTEYDEFFRFTNYLAINLSLNKKI
mgnify:CR=1 FL=1